MTHTAECSLWKTKSIFIFYVPHVGKNSYSFVVIYNKYLHDFSLYSCISEIKVLRSHWYSSLWWSSIKNIIDQSIVVLAALLEALECCWEWWLWSNSSCFCFGPESLVYINQLTWVQLLMYFISNAGVLEANFVEPAHDK